MDFPKLHRRPGLRWARTSASILLTIVWAMDTAHAATAVIRVMANLGVFQSSSALASGCVNVTGTFGNSTANSCLDLTVPKVSADASGAPVGVRGAQSAAAGQLQYTIPLSSFAPAPVPVFSIPVGVSWSGGASLSVAGNQTASSRAHVRIGGLRGGPGSAAAGHIIDDQVLASSFTGAPGGSFSNIDVLWLPVRGGGISVVLQADAAGGAVPDTRNPGSYMASAFADPAFLFDQIAFDVFAQNAGFATFDLTQYFHLDDPFATPLPPTAAQLLVGLLALARWRRRC